MAVQLRYWFIALLTLVTLQTEAQVWLKQLEPSQTGAEYRIKTYSSNGRQHYYLPYDTAYLIPADTLGIVIDSVLYKVKLPGNLIDTAWWSGDTLYIDDDTIHLAVPLGFDTAYIDAPDSLILFLDGKRVGLKLPPDTGTDSQILSYDYAGIYDTISISNGNSIYLVDSFNLVDTAYIHGDTLYILDDTLSFAIPLDTVHVQDFWRDRHGNLPGGITDTIYRSAPIGINVSDPQYTIHALGRFSLFDANNNFVNGSNIPVSLTGTYGFYSGTDNFWANSTGSYNVAFGLNNFKNSVSSDYSFSAGAGNFFNNTSGDYDTGIGYQNFYSNTTGNQNFGVGNWNFYSNTTGTNNTGIGLRNFYSNISGSQNYGTGEYNFYTNSTGYNNYGVGQQNFYYSTTGANNSGFAYRNFYSNTTGNQNFGAGSGNFYTNTTGNNNLGSGYRNFYYNNGDYNMGIGRENFYNSSSASASVGIGYQNFYTYTSGSINIGIGYQNFKLATSSNNSVGIGTNIASLASDLSVNYAVAIGYQDFYSASSLDQVIGIGYRAGYNNAYSNITVIGQSAEADAADQFSVSNTYTTAKLRNYKLNIDQDTTGLQDYFLGLNRPSGEIELQSLADVEAKPQTIDTFDLVGHLVRLSLDRDGEAYHSITLPDTVFISTIDTFDLIGQTIRLSLDRDSVMYHSVTIPIDSVPDHDWHTSTGGTPWSINDNIHTKGKIAINDGYKSIWIGVDSVGYNSTSTGLHNLAVLDSAGWNNTTGYSNHFIGNKAGYSNTTGYKNIYVGAGVGALIDDGKFNVLLGDSVGVKANTLLEGNTIVGYGAAARSSSLYDNVIIGLDAAFFTTGAINLNTVIGPFAATNMSGDNNVLIGHYAGQYTGGNNNVFVGTYAGSAQAGGIQTGTANIAIGESAGEELSTGNYNVYIGSEAGSDATTGSNNVLIGRQAGNTVTGSYNIMIGNAVAFSATTGANNIFLGGQAGENNAGGNKNVFSGYFAGNSNTTGSSNIFIGENAGDYNLTGSNNIVLGTYAGSFASFTARDWELFIGQGDDTTATIWGELNPFGSRILSLNTDSVRLYKYPNTRDDGTISNVLGTGSNGVIQSYLLDTLIAVIDRNITHPSYMSSFWWDSGNDGGAGTEITDGETIQVTGSNGITATRSGNNMIIDGSGTYYGWSMSVNYSFADIIQDGESLNFVAGSGISLGYDGTNFTITNTASSSYSSWAVWVNGSLVDDIIDGEYLNFTGGTGISVSYSGGTTINITNTGDVSSSNELQTLTNSGTTSFTSTLSDGGGSFTLSGGTGISISRSGNTATIASTATFAWNFYLNSSYKEGITNAESWGINEGSGIGVSYDGTYVTITADDVSATNELQTLTNSGTSSFTSTLSSSGGSFTIAPESSGMFYVTRSSNTATIGSNYLYRAGTQINLINTASGGSMLVQAGSGTTNQLNMSHSGHSYITMRGSTYNYDIQISPGTGGLVGIDRISSANMLEVNGDASKTTAGSWLANSDRRIKTDISDVEDAYAIIERLRPVSFRYSDQWRELNPSIKDHPYYNYIAQEYRDVFPDDVKGSGEYLPGDPDEILQIDDHSAQIVTTAAVKQLILDYKALAKRVEELENQLQKKDGKN